MRKRCVRKVRRKTAPTLVAMLNHPEVEARERMAVEAFRAGWAGEAQFNVLADTRDLLMLAAAEKNDRSALVACEVGLVALQNIQARYKATQAMTAEGDELDALQVLVDFSEDWWKRQSGTAFITASAALDLARANN